MKRVSKPGIILDSPRLIAEAPQAELVLDEVGGGQPDWKALIPRFRNQAGTRYCTAYAGCSIASIFEKKEHGQERLFSPAELFFRSNGNIRGNSLLNTARRMKESVVLEKDVPTIKPDDWWRITDFYALQKKSKASEESLRRGRLFRMADFAVIKTDRETMRRELKRSPLYIVIGMGGGYWNDPAPKPKAYSDYHAVVVVGIEDDGTLVVFDSLAGYPKFNGVHRLAPDYPVLYGMVFTDVPVEWRQIQRELQINLFEKALAHYGLRRDFNAEVYQANALSNELQKHPSLTSYFGQEWTVAVNALAYGGYSIQDLLNHYTSLRRGQGGEFDLNERRK